MNGTINPIMLNEVIEYEDLFHEAFEGSTLKSGRIVQIIYCMKPGKSFIAYDIVDRNRKYVNIDDAPSPPSTKRTELGFQTSFNLNQTVDIEIAGVRRTSVIVSITIRWTHDECEVTYGAIDRTDTTYFGIREELMIKWNPPYSE
ncbi:hypothetical protein QTG56_16805 [Rossellomorea sp. AcN35-11]|nr:hypothetical protein [Rossellomorea aquimaris]WJV28701.1 hypothetical protein QTG56_16805 [Rossellomorea sp. AcN35-11]